MNKRAIETEIIETGEQRDGRGRRITPAAANPNGSNPNVCGPLGRRAACSGMVCRRSWRPSLRLLSGPIPEISGRNLAALASDATRGTGRKAGMKGANFTLGRNDP